MAQEGTRVPFGARPSVGTPLPLAYRHEMEAAFAADLSQVRIHEGYAAVHRGADAFTQGTEIHFAPGKYQPLETGGRELLAFQLADVVAHEAAHVVQQDGAVRSPSDE